MERTPIRIQLEATRVTMAAVSMRSRRTLTPGMPTRARAREVGRSSAAMAAGKGVSCVEEMSSRETYLPLRGIP
jgi:hypothetical protein